MSSTSPDKNIGHIKATEAAPGVVSQPVKIESHLSGQLGSFLEEVNRMSENAAGSASEQWSGAGGGAMTTGGQQSGQTAVSARDQAIANIPSAAVMQKQLEKHIRDEVKKLRKQAQTISRMSKPGGAYHLNQLYSRIRHLNALLAEILEASVDALKRFFIRVFIDKQSIS